MTPDDQAPRRIDRPRHGCLTVIIVLSLLWNGIVFLYTTVGASLIREPLPGMTQGVITISAILALAEMGCLIAILRWRRWGVWGLCLLAPVGILRNLALGGVTMAISGLSGTALNLGLLYAALQLGGEARGWSRLK